MADHVHCDKEGSIDLVRQAGLRIAEGRAHESVRLLATGLAWCEAHRLHDAPRPERAIDQDLPAARDMPDTQAFVAAWVAGRRRSKRRSPTR